MKSPSQIWSYEKVKQRLPFLFFIAFLAVVYIWNGKSSERVFRERTKVQQQLKEKNWEYTTVKHELNNRSTQSHVARQVKGLGLRELTKPPERIQKTE